MFIDFKIIYAFMEKYLISVEISQFSESVFQVLSHIPINVEMTCFSNLLDFRKD